MAVSIVSLAILARLLEPADFGLLALGTVWHGLLGVVRDFGLPLAAVHHGASGRGVDGALLERLHRHNLRLQGALALSSLAAGPLFALAYGDPRLRGVVWALSAATVFLGTASPPRALLIGEVRFATLAGVEVAGAAAGAVLAVAWAVGGGGYWALVLFHAGRGAVSSALLWAAAGWRPRRWLPRRRRSSPGDGRDVGGAASDLPAEVRGYGRRSTWARMVAYLGRHLDRALLGFFVPTAALGFYQQARRWSSVPAQGLQAPLLEVAVSLLSHRRGEPAALRAGFTAASRAALCLTLPVLTFLLVEAPTAVALLLGPGWEPVVPLLRLLAGAFLVAAPLAQVKWLFLALGRTRRQLAWTTAVSLAQVVAVAVAASAGTTRVAMALLAVAVVTTPASVAYACAGTPVKPRDFAAALAPAALAAALAAGAVVVAAPMLAGLAARAGGATSTPALTVAAPGLAAAAARGLAAGVLFLAVYTAGLALSGWGPRRLIKDLRRLRASPSGD